jgi:hypothetical protein
MLTRPEDISDSDLATMLGSAWGFDARDLRYQAVGFGSHHWIATGAGGERRFLTVDVLSEPSSGGTHKAEVLRSAFETAHALRHGAGCDFVLAPERNLNGRVLERLNDQFSLALFPFVDGATGSFDIGHGGTAERAAVIDLLVALHGATGAIPANITGREDFALAGRNDLEEALSDLNVTWRGGPYAEPARGALSAQALKVQRLLAQHDALVSGLDGDNRGWVITHGEPHAANVMDTPAGRMLIDWDTTLLAPPERDLWMVATESGEETARYEKATGARINREALSLYRLRWDLANIGLYVAQFRRSHVESADCVASWRNLKQDLREASRPGRYP